MRERSGGKARGEAFCHRRAGDEGRGAGKGAAHHDLLHVDGRDRARTRRAGAHDLRRRAAHRSHALERSGACAARAERDPADALGGKGGVYEARSHLYGSLHARRAGRRPPRARHSRRRVPAGAQPRRRDLQHPSCGGCRGRAGARGKTRRNDDGGARGAQGTRGRRTRGGARQERRLYLHHGGLRRRRVQL